MAGITHSITDNAKKVLIALGKNNKPTYTMMAIACANGIFKPLSSLTDKKEKPEARKYAALREFLTECVAVPTYWACGTGASKLGEKLYKNSPEKQVLAKTNMNFMGVCVAALFVIPALCSVVMDAIDGAMGKGKKPEPSQKLDVTSQTPELNVYNENSPASDMPKFGNIVKPDMNVFANRGGLKI